MLYIMSQESTYVCLIFLVFLWQPVEGHYVILLLALSSEKFDQSGPIQREVHLTILLPNFIIYVHQYRFVNILFNLYLGKFQFFFFVFRKIFLLTHIIIKLHFFNLSQFFGSTYLKSYVQHQFNFFLCKKIQSHFDRSLTF